MTTNYFKSGDKDENEFVCKCGDKNAKNMNENNFICEKVNNENLDLAIKVQNAIFPNENGAFNLKASADASFIEEVYGKDYRKSVDFGYVKMTMGNPLE